jgi:hypothetical protein
VLREGYEAGSRHEAEGGVSALVKEGRLMPTKLSEWLRVAVEDTRRIPAECSTPGLRFVADMSTYVRSTEDGVCHVCLAGCALLGTGVWQPPKTGDLLGWENGLACAINSLRAGDVNDALQTFLQREEVPALTGRVERAAECVAEEALAAFLSYEDDPTSEELRDELRDGPSKDARASDAAYLELADALAEMGL